MPPKGKKPTKVSKPPKPAKPAAGEAPLRVDAIKHKDTRVNIPTNELRKFVRKAEDQYPVTLYPRNPELDPQLVWKGKDQQDSEPLAVPAVPIYIQEKIRPQSIIENLKRQTKERRTDVNLELFADFNGIESFEDKIDFYHHEGHWTNRMILGDSLLVMNSMVEKEGMKGKVQTIYFDPPYGIRFGSNWQQRTEKEELGDGDYNAVSREPEQIKAFRDTWKLGVHSYLDYLRDRLTVCRGLLSETGSVFVQISEANVHLVRVLMDEVFGPKNHCATIEYVTTSTQGSTILPIVNDSILWYAKNIDQVKYRPLFEMKEFGETGSKGYNYLEMENGEITRINQETVLSDIKKKYRVFAASDPTSSHVGPNEPVNIDGKEFTPGKRYWSTSIEGMKKLAEAGRLMVVGNSLRYKRYFDDFPAFPRTNFWTDTGLAGFSAERKIYVVQTNTKVIERCILMTTEPGDLVFDPTCGSGTTAYVSEQWGRRWITIDTSRIALTLARTRMMAARFPYYFLSDSAEGAKKEAEISGSHIENPTGSYDVKRGFVYKRVSHVTLKSIANNSNIRSGMSQEEKEAVIRRNAENEYLYDQPYEDPKRIRVSGPFTVESLSPHRLLDPREAAVSKDVDSSLTSEIEATDFRVQILDNLRKAGIQNTKKRERLVFDSLEPHSGAWVHAKGHYTDKDGTPKFVAVSIGPKYGTITPQHVQEAAKEAMKGAGHHLLVILGFAFGGYVPDEVKQFGELTILIVRMNPDLMMGDELLKKTGAGNLFTVFGEPDIDHTFRDGLVTVNIKGVDIYDPTTGEVRSSKPEEIACWFIDTDYNDESFFVRHAYFLGDDEPYEKLKRALKAEVDEDAWSQLYSAKSRPFEKPSTGRFAVKVINHYGDEVMKVFEVK